MPSALLTLALGLALVVASALGPGRQEEAAQERFTPKRVTEQTRKDAEALAALQKPGRILFQDDFESEASLGKYFEIRGRDDGRARLSDETAHGGQRSMRFTAPARDGASSGSGASGWLGSEGYDRLHFRRWIRFAKDYDQGHLNHTGGGLAAIATDGKWDQMGMAGVRPKGDDRFTVGFEPWRDWGRYESPGYMFCYVYWMDMEQGGDGNWWGNMLGPEEEQRLVPKRGSWVCLETMVKANTPGKADGELATWIDGKLYLHYAGIRWRSSEKVRLKRFDFGIYIHEARRDNTVWYDDVAVSTGYIGTR